MGIEPRSSHTLGKLSTTPLALPEQFDLWTSNEFGNYVIEKVK